MGLLGDGWSDPQSAANMALAAGMIRGDLGGGLLGASNAITEAQQNALKRQFMQAQMANMQSEVQTRQAALAKQQQLQDMLRGALGPQDSAPSQPSMPGQLGSGSFGAVQPPAGMPSIPMSAPSQQGSSRIGSMSPDVLAMMKANGLDLVDVAKLARPDMQVSNGFAYDKNRLPPGFMPQLNISQNGTSALVMPGADGLPTISMPRGAALTQAQNTIATKLPEQVIASAGKVNLRPNADGTQSPVPELSETPFLQGFANQVFGMPAAGQSAPPQGVPPMPSPVPGQRSSAVVSPQQQRGADAETLQIMQAELSKAPPEQRPGLQREIARIQQGLAQPGFPTPSLIRNPQGYGKTTAQDTAEAVAKAAATTTATGAATAGQSYQNDLNSKVEEEFQLVNRNKQIMPLLDKFKTGGMLPEERLHLGNTIANSGMLPDSIKQPLAAWVANGDPTAGKVIENQLASAGILNMLQTLDKEGKPNRAIFQAVQKAQEGLNSGNTTLKDVFELQKRLYDIHYTEQQALTKAIKGGTYDPRTWAGDYSSVRNADLNSPAAPLPSTVAAGNTGGATGSFGGPSSFVSSLPKTAPKGARARDTQTGDVLTFNGLTWVKK